MAAAAYLVGPGFAVGTGTTVGIGVATHGVLPAFPLLAGLPSGSSPSWMWVPMVAVPVTAGVLAASVSYRAANWRDRWCELGAGAALAGAAAVALTWQAGGGIGSGRLATIGASPWQVGLAVSAELGAVGAMTFGALAAASALRRRSHRTPVLWVDAAPEPVAAAAIEDDLELASAEATSPDEGPKGKRLAG
jgi:hypothetical protein